MKSIVYGQTLEAGLTAVLLKELASQNSVEWQWADAKPLSYRPLWLSEQSFSFLQNYLKMKRYPLRAYEGFEPRSLRFLWNERAVPGLSHWGFRVDREDMFRHLTLLAQHVGVTIRQVERMPRPDSSEDSLLCVDLSSSAQARFAGAVSFDDTTLPRVFHRSIWLPRAAVERADAIVEIVSGSLAILEPHAREGMSLGLWGSSELEVQRAWECLLKPRQLSHPYLRAAAILNVSAPQRVWNVELGASPFVYPQSFAVGRSLGQSLGLFHADDDDFVIRSRELFDLVSIQRVQKGRPLVGLTEQWEQTQKQRIQRRAWKELSFLRMTRSERSRKIVGLYQAMLSPFEKLNTRARDLRV